MSLTGKDRSTRALPSTAPFALEVADAAGEQHHLADGQLRHLLRRILRCGFIGFGGRGPGRQKDECAQREQRAAAQTGQKPFATHDSTP